jgi:hypothetical protein
MTTVAMGMDATGITTCCTSRNTVLRRRNKSSFEPMERTFQCNDMMIGLLSDCHAKASGSTITSIICYGSREVRAVLYSYSVCVFCNLEQSYRSVEILQSMFRLIYLLHNILQLSNGHLPQYA